MKNNTKVFLAATLSSLLLASCNNKTAVTTSSNQPVQVERNDSFSALAVIAVQQIQTGESLDSLTQQGMDTSNAVGVPSSFKNQMDELANQVSLENPELQTATVWLSDWAQIKNPTTFGLTSDKTIGLFVYAADFKNIGTDWGVKVIVNMTDWSIVAHKTNTKPKTNSFQTGSNLEW